jgi:hypothetical protein
LQRVTFFGVPIFRPRKAADNYITAASPVDFLVDLLSSEIKALSD